MRSMVLGFVLALSFACGDDGTAYDPCANLDCGDECQLCDPNDPECIETPSIKLCNASGVCSSDPTTCP